MDSSINRGSKPTLADEDYEVFGLNGNNEGSGKSSEINITIEQAIKGMREKSRFGSTAVGAEDYSDSKNVDQEECDAITFGDRDIVQHAIAMPKPVGVAHYVQFDMDHNTLCGYEVATAEEIGLGPEISVCDSSLRKEYIDNNESGSEDVSTEEVFDELENRDDLIEEFQSPVKNNIQYCKDETITKFVHTTHISKTVDKQGTLPLLIDHRNKSDQVNNKSDIALFYESIAPSLVDERNEPVVTNRHLYDDKMPVLLPEIDVAVPESNAIPEQVIGVVHPFNHEKRPNEDKRANDASGIAVFSNNKKPLNPPTEIITRNRIRSHCLDSVTNVPRSMIKKHHSLVLKRDPITKAIPTILNGISDKYSENHNAEYISNDVNIPQGISSGNHFRTVYKEVKQIVPCDDPKEILNENEHSSLESRLLFTIKNHSAKVPEKNKFTASVYDVYDFNDDSCDGKTEEYKTIRSSYMSKGKKIYDVEEKMKDDKINNHFNKAHDTQIGTIGHNERKKGFRRHSPNITSMPILMSPTRDPSPPPLVKNYKGETSKKSINQDVTRKQKTFRSTATPLRSFQRLPINALSQTIPNTNKKNTAIQKNSKFTNSVNKPITPPKKINATTVAPVVQDISNDLKDFGLDLLERELNFDPCERVTRSSARKKEYLEIKTEPLTKYVINKRQLNNPVINVNSPDFVPLEALTIDTKENDGSFLTFDNLLTDLSPDQTTNPLDDSIHSPLFMKDIQSSTDILEVLPGPDILDGGVADKEVVISSADVHEIKTGIVEEVQTTSLGDKIFATIDNLFDKNISSSKTDVSQQNKCINNAELLFEKINKNPSKESSISLDQVNSDSTFPVPTLSLSSTSVDNQVYNKESKAVEILRTIINEVHSLNKETNVQNNESGGPFDNDCNSRPINNIIGHRKNSLSSVVLPKKEKLSKKQGSNAVATNSRMSDSNFNSPRKYKHKTQGGYQKKLRLGKKRSYLLTKRKSGYNFKTIKKLESSDQLSNIISQTPNFIENNISSDSAPKADSNRLCRRHHEIKSIQIGDVLKRLDENVKICTNATSDVVINDSQNLKDSLEENSNTSLNAIEKDQTKNHSIVEDYAASNKIPSNGKSDSASDKVNCSDTVDRTQPSGSSAVKIQESDSNQKKLSNIQVLVKVNNLENCNQQSLSDQSVDVSSLTDKASQLKLTSECVPDIKKSEKTDFNHDPSKGGLVTVAQLNKPAKVSNLLQDTKIHKSKSKNSELTDDGVVRTSKKIINPQPNSEVGKLKLANKQVMTNSKGSVVPNKRFASSDGALKIPNPSPKPTELSVDSVQTIENEPALKNKDNLCSKVIQSAKSPVRKKRLEPKGKKAGLEYIIKKLTLKSEEKHTNDDEHPSKKCDENKVIGLTSVDSLAKIETDADQCKSTSDSILQESTDNSSDIISGCHLETEIIHDNLDAQLELIYVKNDLKQHSTDNKSEEETFKMSKFNEKPGILAQSVSSETISEVCIENLNEISLESSKINANVSEICQKDIVRNKYNVPPQLETSTPIDSIEETSSKGDQKIKANDDCAIICKTVEINDDLVESNILKEGFKSVTDKVTADIGAICATEKNQNQLDTSDAVKSTPEKSVKILKIDPIPRISDILDDAVVSGKEYQNKTDPVSMSLADSKEISHGQPAVITESAKEHQIENVIVERMPYISSKSVKINPGNNVRLKATKNKLNSNVEILNSIEIKAGCNEKAPVACDVSAGTGINKKRLHKPINGLNANFNYSNIATNFKEKSSEVITTQENKSEKLVEQNHYENEINLKSEKTSLLKSSVELAHREPLVSQDENKGNLKQVNNIDGLVQEKKLIPEEAIVHDKPIGNSVILDQDTRTENILEKTCLKSRVVNCESKKNETKLVFKKNKVNAAYKKPKERNIKKVYKLYKSEMVNCNCEVPKSSVVCHPIAEKILENTNLGAGNEKSKIGPPHIVISNEIELHHVSIYKIGDNDKKFTADITGFNPHPQIEEDNYTKESSTSEVDQLSKNGSLECEPINRSTGNIDKEKLNMTVSGGPVKDNLLSRLKSNEITTKLNMIKSDLVSECQNTTVTTGTKQHDVSKNSSNKKAFEEHVAPITTVTNQISDSKVANNSALEELTESTIHNSASNASIERDYSTVDNDPSDTLDKKVPNNSEAIFTQSGNFVTVSLSKSVSENLNTIQDCKIELLREEHLLSDKTITNQTSDLKIVHLSTTATNPSDISKEINDPGIDNSKSLKELNDPTLDNGETLKGSSDSTIDNSSVNNDRICTSEEIHFDTLQEIVPTNIDTVVTELGTSDSTRESKLFSESLNTAQASKPEFLREECVPTVTTVINQISDTSIGHSSKIQSSKEPNDQSIDNRESSKELNDPTMDCSKTSKESGDSAICNNPGDISMEQNDYTIINNETLLETSDSTVDNSDTSLVQNDNFSGISKEHNYFTIDNSVKSTQLYDSTIDNVAISETLNDSNIDISTSLVQNESTIYINPGDISKEPNDSTIINNEILLETSDSAVNNNDMLVKKADSANTSLVEKDNSIYNSGGISKEHNYSTTDDSVKTTEQNYYAMDNSVKSTGQNDYAMDNSVKSTEQNDSTINDSVKSTEQDESTINDSVKSTGQNDYAMDNSVKSTEQNDSTINDSVKSTEQDESTINDSVKSTGQNDYAMDNSVKSTEQNDSTINDSVKSTEQDESTINDSVKSTGQNDYAMDNSVKSTEQNDSTINDSVKSTEQDESTIDDSVKSIEQKDPTVDDSVKSTEQNDSTINDSVKSTEQDESTIDDSVKSIEQNDYAMDNSAKSTEQNDSTINDSVKSTGQNNSTMDKCVKSTDENDHTIDNAATSETLNDSTIDNSDTSSAQNNSTMDNTVKSTEENDHTIDNVATSETLHESTMDNSVNSTEENDHTIDNAATSETLNDSTMDNSVNSAEENDHTTDNAATSETLNDSTIDNSDTTSAQNSSTMDKWVKSAEENDHTIDNAATSETLNDSTIDNSDISSAQNNSTMDNSVKSTEENDHTIDNVATSETLNDSTMDNSVKSTEENDHTIDNAATSETLNDSTIDNSDTSSVQNNSTMDNSVKSTEENDHTIDNVAASETLNDSTIDNSDTSSAQNDHPIDNVATSETLNDSTIDNSDTSSAQNDSTIDDSVKSTEQNDSTINDSVKSTVQNNSTMDKCVKSAEENDHTIDNAATSETLNDSTIDNSDISSAQNESIMDNSVKSTEENDHAIDNAATSETLNDSTIDNSDTSSAQNESTVDHSVDISKELSHSNINNAKTLLEKADSTIDSICTYYEQNYSNSTIDNNESDRSKEQVSEEGYAGVTCSEGSEIGKSEIVSKALNTMQNSEVDQYYIKKPDAKTNNYSTMSSNCNMVDPLGLDPSSCDFTRVTSSNSKNISSNNTSTCSTKIALLSQNETPANKLESGSFPSLIFNCVQCQSISGSSINNDNINSHSRQLIDPNPNITTIIHSSENSCRKLKAASQQISENNTDTDLSQIGNSSPSVKTSREGDIYPLEKYTRNVSLKSNYNSHLTTVMTETKSKLSGINEVPDSEEPKSEPRINKPSNSFCRQYDIFLEDSKNVYENSARKVKTSSATESNEQDEILQRLIKDYKGKSKEDKIVDTNITTEQNSTNKTNMANNIKPNSSLMSDELIKKYKLKDLKIMLKNINTVSQAFDVMPTVNSNVSSSKKIRQLLGHNNSIKRTSTSNDIKEPPRKILHVESPIGDPHLALDENKREKIVKETSHGNSGTPETNSSSSTYVETVKKKEVNLSFCCPILPRLGRFADIYKCMEEHKVSRVSIPIIIYNSFKKADGHLLALRPDLEINCTKPVERKTRYKRRRRKVSSSETDEFEYDDSSAVSLASKTRRRTSKRTRESKRSKINQRREVSTDEQETNSQPVQQEQSSRVLGLSSVNDTSSSGTAPLTCKRPINKEFTSKIHPKPTNLKDLNCHYSSSTCSSKEPETVLLPTAKKNLLGHKSSPKIPVPDGTNRQEKGPTLPEMVSTCSSRGLAEVLTAENMRKLLHTVAKNRRLNQRVENSDDEEDSDDDFFGFKDCHCPAYTRCQNNCYISRWEIKHEYLSSTIVLLSSENMNPCRFRTSRGEEQDVCRADLEPRQQTSCNFRTSSEESSVKKRGIRRKNEEQLCQQTNAKRFRDPDHNKICFVSLGSRSGSVVKTVKQKRFLSSQDSQSQLVVAVKNIQERRPSPQVARRAETSNSEEDASSEDESSESSS